MRWVNQTVGISRILGCFLVCDLGACGWYFAPYENEKDLEGGANLLGSKIVRICWTCKEQKNPFLCTIEKSSEIIWSKPRRHVETTVLWHPLDFLVEGKLIMISKGLFKLVDIGFCFTCHGNLGMKTSAHFEHCLIWLDCGRGKRHWMKSEINNYRTINTSST